MLAFLAVVLFQQPVVAPTAPVRDTVTRTDSAGTTGKRDRAPKRKELTAALLASAFRDEGARRILTIARVARMRQDSALQSYDATTYQRISAGLGLSRLARERLAFRSEAATRVRWRRNVGAYVEVTGSRAVVPIAGRSGHADVGGNLSPIPYYPGSETLWIGASVAKPDVDENEGIVHPLANGAEAYFTYESGDSVSFRLPGGRTIQLRELRVRPRVPQWNLAVGSLWFDMTGGELVRAAYRMSVPMDIGQVATEDDSSSFDDVPRVMKPMLFPMTASVSAIGVEYGLYDGRFWLPRLQVAEGGAGVGFLRVPFKLEQRYEYAQVNAGEPLPPIQPPTDSSRHFGQGVNVTVGGGAEDSTHTHRHKEAPCDSAGMRTYTRARDDGAPLERITVTCDTARLAHSPDLPPSIYDAGDEAFGKDEMDALVSQALSMGAQASFAPQPPDVSLELPRYNRVEGLSLGIRADEVLGAGYSAHAVARLGVADREPVVELTGARSDLRRTVSLTAYNRLVSAGDWGNPFSFGRSLNAFVFGRDEGFYYRASGLELASAPDVATGRVMTWALFAERERTAAPRTSFSLARSAFGVQFDTNLVARRGLYAGARARLTQTFGLDPEGFRLSSDLRLEGARGDSAGYGRLAIDLTASHGIGNGAAALTLAAGTSAGFLPAQRLWYLGGSQTVRGQLPGTEYGDAFWLARAEVARGLGAVRPVIFGDLGWAGDRTRLGETGRPMSGVGAGLSALDGLVRFDVARGIWPRQGWRVDSYLEARF